MIKFPFFCAHISQVIVHVDLDKMLTFMEKEDQRINCDALLVTGEMFNQSLERVKNNVQWSCLMLFNLWKDIPLS